MVFSPDDDLTLPPASPARRTRPVAAPQGWHLHVLTSPDVKLVDAQVPISQEGLWIGRRPVREPGLRVDDPSMSRTHVWIGPTLSSPTDVARRSGVRQQVRQHVRQSVPVGGLDCHDERSQNGTFVDGERHTATTLVAPAVLRLGGTVLLVEPVADARVPPSAASALLPGQSADARRVRAALADAAACGEPVWLYGETGTGKEFATLALHELSGRSGPLVKLSLPAIAPGEFEAELFGHQSQGRRGRIAEADGGTLLLDAIDELPLDLQAKLLRVLEEGVVRAVGGQADIRVNVQFVATARTDPTDPTTHPRVRRDLLVRFRNHWIALAPLRERQLDLLAIADQIVPLPAPHTWRTALNAEALECLLLHPWHDNMRELRAVLTRLRRLIGDARPLEPADLQFAMYNRPLSGAEVPEAAIQTLRPPSTMPSRAELTRLLREHNGNVNAIARAQGRDRKQVYRWLEYARVSEAELERFRGSRPAPGDRDSEV